MKCRLSNIMLLVATALAAAALTGCSLKKNTAVSRKYSEFITRYNIYYNGDTHYKETLQEMERRYEDDFSQTLYVHPAEARQNEKAPQPAGDFTRSIEKAQKAIQVRSLKAKPKKKPGKASDPEYKAWMKRDEYNPFLHNAWMMMGRSQFLNGDFLGAAATFFYISKHFTWLPNTVTEAKLWQARSYIAIDWLFEAENIITRIKPDEIEGKTALHLYNLTFADFWIKSHDNAKAVPYLLEAIKTASGPQKTRLNFLLGQLYESLGEKSLAYKAFAKAGGSASAPYRTKFNARIKQSEVFQGTDITSEVKALRRMTRYDRNKDYLDQIYYAIGNLYLSRRDTAKAIENYALAVEKSTRSGIDKALAQLTLGGLYYRQGRYDLAQPCYSEAMPKIPENYPDYRSLKKRSDYLDELATYSQNVYLQDSLLKLSFMTPDEQTKVAERLIKELKKKEKEEAEKAKLEEYQANKDAQGSTLDNKNAPSSFNINNDNSWYFYNPSTVTAGKTDFQRRWGSRKLEDNWRRRNKASYAFDTGETEEEADDESTDSADTSGDSPKETEADREAAERENDPHFVEYYLKQIPKDDQERQVCNDVIQEGLYNIGVILKDKLEDFPASEREFDKLLKRYPDNVYRLDAYYNLYLMYVRTGNKAMAERYRQLILSDFPDSNYGLAMRDPNYIENLRAMDENQERLYSEAYEAYLDNRNADVHTAYRQMSDTYPLSKLMPKFMFIDALAYVTENRPEEFRNTLTELLEKYPDTDITPYAASYLKGMREGRELHAGASGTNMRGMIWDIRLTNDSTAVGSDTPLEFELNPDAEQLFVLMYPTDEVAPNQVLYEIARHNFNSFVVKDFDLEQMNFGRLGLLIVKPFANVAEINHYRSVMADNASLRLPPQVRPVIISRKNFDTLLSGAGSFDDYFRYVQDKTYRDTEESVLPPEFFGPSEGLDDEETPSAEPAEATPLKDGGLPARSPAEEYFDESLDEETVAGTAPAFDGPETLIEEEIVDELQQTPATEEQPVEEEPVPEEQPTEEQPAAEEQPAEDAEEPVIATPESTPLKDGGLPARSPAEEPAVKQPSTEEPAAEQPAAETPATPAKPATKPQTPAKPQLPVYPVGSEGDDDPDDPLLFNP